MKLTKITALAFALLLCSSCYSLSKRSVEQSAQRERAKANSDPAETSAGLARQGQVTREQVTRDPAATKMQPVSLKQVDQSQSVTEAVERKIIKDAELTLEVPSPTDAQHKVTAIAESQNGFVVTSESKQRPVSDDSQRLWDITLVLRVPSAQFGSVLDQVRAISNVVTQEKQTGQDVTEEFIDLEARIRTQKALETQFLEIMKQAHKVEEALEVQRQIAEVRSEIEKLEGRKRFLENRSSLSTITVNLKQTGTGIVVNTSGFGRRIKDAVSEGIDLAGSIILFLIQFVIVMMPIFVLLILPLGLLLRYFVRRARRYKLAREIAGETPATATSTGA